MSIFRVAVITIASAYLLVVALPASALDWPQEVNTDEGTIIVYQPQPERFKGNQLSGRAAAALVPEDGGEQVFGSFWFEARMEADRDAGTALVRDLHVLKVRWPESTDAMEQRFTALVEAAMPTAGFTISLERLTASLATAELEQESLKNLNNDPPAIVFRERLAVLLSYDGEPRYEDIENSDYQRVINAPIAVVRNKRGQHFVTNGRLWYQATSAMGPWVSTTAPPPDLVKAMPAPDSDLPDWDTPPEIVVATRPTELIVTDGAPQWKPLEGGQVLYVTNTESPWLRDLPTGNMYLLLSGRWFRAKSTSGPWTFVPADELPTAFADIPPASEIGGLRTSVAGTPEAQEAVLDAQIPQTAAISRDATLTVEYDGAPKFEDIPGTSVAYAVNTATQVLDVDGVFYAVDNGVWFTAPKAAGPWSVATSVPDDEIKKIPPSSPVYNTTYVSVFDATPDVVYMGYTPGYLWSFPYYGVPVYGSGWYYPPYPGPWYYPRPPTWGFNAGYNPWTGWSFGLSWSSGFFNFGVSWGGYNRYHHGWYGGGYRGPVVINTGNINIGNNINVGNRVDLGDRIERNKLDINRDSLRRDNLYNRAETRDRKANPQTLQRNLKQASSSTKLANNVYADRDGRVVRNKDNQWQTRDSGGWKQDSELNRPGTRELSKPAVGDNSRPLSGDLQKPTLSNHRQRDLENARRARDSGALRERRRVAPQRQMHRNLRR